MGWGTAPVTVLVVVGAVLTGCGSPSSTDSSTPPSTPPPAPSVAPLAPDEASIVAAVAELPAGSCHARHVVVTDPQAWLPDAKCTSGAVDGGLPAAQLCPVANTKRVRPPVAYTNRLKIAQMRAYGDGGSPASYEEDHLIPLSVGGSPKNPANLWPEPGASTNEKDRVEFAAHDAVCSGHLTLADAQHRIATNWYQLGKDLNVIH